jgi:hypothetical protein
VASFLHIPLASSSNLHVDEEFNNKKWNLEFGGQKPNPNMTKFWYLVKSLVFIFGTFC